MVQYVTGWTRKDFSTNAQYEAWLAGLQDHSEAWLQEFVPTTSSCLGMPFERWRYTKGHVIKDGQGFIFCERGDSKPITAEGKACYYSDRKIEWGEVFPARLVRPHSDLIFTPRFETYGHAPIYEPEFIGCYRHVFLDPHGASYGKLARAIERQYRRRAYRQDRNIHGGCLVIAFSPDLVPADDPIQPLYSEYLDP